MDAKANEPSNRGSIVDYSKTPPDPKQTINTDSDRPISKANSQSFVNNSRKTHQPSKKYPSLKDRVSSKANPTALNNLSTASFQDNIDKTNEINIQNPSKLSILEKIKQTFSSEKMKQKLKIITPVLLGMGSLVSGILLAPVTGGISLFPGAFIAMISFGNAILAYQKQKPPKPDSVQTNQVSNTENNKSTEDFDRIDSKDAASSSLKKDSYIDNDNRTDVLNNIQADQDNKNSTDYQSNSGTKYNNT